MLKRAFLFVDNISISLQVCIQAKKETFGFFRIMYFHGRDFINKFVVFDDTIEGVTFFQLFHDAHIERGRQRIRRHDLLCQIRKFAFKV